MEISPQSDGSNSWPPYFVQFRVTNHERFLLLVQAFEMLKQEKLKLSAKTFEDDEKQYSVLHEKALRRLTDNLFDLFDEQTLAHFRWFSIQKAQDYRQRWFATPIPQRWTDPTLKTPWDLESMTDAFLNGEYELLACRLLTPDTGVLGFLPFAFPYGSTDCMKALIGAFDFPIIGENGGTGYVSYI